MVPGHALLLVHGASCLPVVQGAANSSVQVPAMKTPAVVPVGPVVVGNVSVGVHCAACVVHLCHASCIGG